MSCKNKLKNDSKVLNMLWWLPFWLKKKSLPWLVEQKNPLFFPWLIPRSAINDLISKKNSEKEYQPAFCLQEARPCRAVYHQRSFRNTCRVSQWRHQENISTTLKESALELSPTVLEEHTSRFVKKKNPRLSLRKRLTEFKQCQRGPPGV